MEHMSLTSPGNYFNTPPIQRDIAYVHILRHTDIGLIVEESDVRQVWRALPVIYETLAVAPMTDTDLIVTHVENHNVFGGDLSFMDKHHLHIVITRMRESLPDLSDVVMVLESLYLIEVSVIDWHTVALGFTDVFVDY